jgi:hypothetical protein
MRFLALCAGLVARRLTKHVRRFIPLWPEVDQERGVLWAACGVRGDIRNWHAFQDLNALGFTLSDTRLDFGRASVALVLTF